MTPITPRGDVVSVRKTPLSNGAAVAAVLASGIGACAMGLIVVLAVTGIFSTPALYGPAGGVSGRTTLATAVWLVAWGVLHSRWRGRDVDVRRLWRATLVLIVLGVLGTVPPVW
jgi:hypothetical protein